MNGKNIITDTASLYGCDAEDLQSRRRYRKFADARKVVCYILCSLCGMSYSEVGRLLNRTHASVIYFENKADEWVRTPKLNPDAVAHIKQIAEKYNIKL